MDFAAYVAKLLAVLHLYSKVLAFRLPLGLWKQKMFNILDISTVPNNYAIVPGS